MITVDKAPVPVVDPKRWHDLGSFLSRPDLLLVAASTRRSSEAEWEEITGEERELDDSLLIGLVGGTGVGKSTFVNALAGQQVSRSGDRRPTTDRVVVYRHVDNELTPRVPVRDLSQPQVLHKNPALERVTLLDFPDFDSAETNHRETLLRYLPHLDVVFVIVDDVKYGDRRLYELLSGLDQDRRNFFAILNKVDRLENRYGSDWERVAAEILSDLRDKLSQHADLLLDEDQTIAISALGVFENREAGDKRRLEGEFSRVEGVLDSYCQAKRRKAAKELNLESRKRRLMEDLCARLLNEENRSILGESARLVTSLGTELDHVVAGISVEVLSEGERRGLRQGRLRRVGPAWGPPFSILFTLIGELYRVRGKSLPDEAGGGLGKRVYQHYRAYLEALRNLRARFEVEVQGGSFSSQAMSGGEEDPALDEPSLLDWTGGLAAQFYVDIGHGEKLPSRRARFVSHVPALGTVGLGVWSLFHPLLESLVADDGASSGFFAELAKGFVQALNPIFLGGLVLTVVMAYGLTGLYLWVREVQKLDATVDESEREMRRGIHDRGRRVVDSLGEQVTATQKELRELERLLSDSA